MSVKNEERPRVNVLRIILPVILFLSASYLAWGWHLENIEREEREKKRKANAPAPLIHAGQEVLVPLRELDQLSSHALGSAEWSKPFARNAAQAGVQQRFAADDFRRKAELLDQEIKALDAHRARIKTLETPSDWLELKQADLKTANRVLELLRLRRGYLLELLENGSYFSNDKDGAFFRDENRIEASIASSLAGQQRLRKTKFKKYEEVEPLFKAPPYSANTHRSVNRSMLSLLDSKYQENNSLWYWRRTEEKTLAELQLADSPYLLEPLHQAQIRYHQEVVDLAQSLMREEPQSIKELDKRTLPAEDRAQELEQESFVFKLYPTAY